MKAPGLDASCPTAWPDKQQGFQKSISRTATHPVHISMLHQPSHTTYSDAVQGHFWHYLQGPGAHGNQCCRGASARRGWGPPLLCVAASDLCQGQCPSPGQGSWCCSRCSSCSCYLGTHFGKTFSLPVTQGADSSQVHPKDE